MFVLAGHQSDTASHLPGMLGTRRSRGTEKRIVSAANEGCIASGEQCTTPDVPQAGLIVPRPPFSSASDRRDKHPPLDLPWRSHECTRPSGHGKRCYLRGSQLKGKPKYGADAADSVAKEAEPVLFSRTSVRAQDRSPSSPEEEGSTPKWASAIDCEGPPPAHASFR